MYIYKLFFATHTLFTLSTQTMEPLEKGLLTCLSPESLAIIIEQLSLKPLNIPSAQELTFLFNSMSLGNNHQLKPKSKFERIVDLSIALNTCLIKDETYYQIAESLSKEYFPLNKTPSQSPKTELKHATRETLKKIVRLTKHSPPDLILLEQTIYEIPSFQLKYILNTRGSPFFIEDTTSRYKQEMLAALQK